MRFYKGTNLWLNAYIPANCTQTSSFSPFFSLLPAGALSLQAGPGQLPCGLKTVAATGGPSGRGIAVGLR